MLFLLRKFWVVVRLVVVVGLFAGALSITALTIGPHIGELATANTSTTPEIRLGELSLNSRVFAADGTELGVLHGEFNRELVELDAVSDELIRSILVAEDENFYEHRGVNMRAIVRALIENVNAGGISQGGSTITQQLVKNSVIGNDDQDLLDRKIPEAALAIRLENDLEKDEILELYVNTVYFGGGAYGVNAAADLYFGKSVGEIDWAEGAMLASLISAPVEGDPTRNPTLAKERRGRVLSRLVETEDITEDERAFYHAQPVPRDRRSTEASIEGLEDDYFLEEVKQILLDEPALGATRDERIEAVFAGGLRIYTTLNPDAQTAAEEAVASIVPDDPRAFTAATASVEPGTGAVRALVGGPGFEVFKFNIATQKGRPTGSSFKPFVLATAMEEGFVPADIIDGTGTCEFDNPSGFPDPYTAENFGGSGGRVATLRSQTLSSSNCGYLRLGQIVGLTNVVDVTESLGVTAPLTPVISMPLGPLDITPLEMAAAYSTFANDGVAVEPYFIDRVEDSQGNILYEHEPMKRRAISSQSARLVNEVLEANVQSGTGTAARLDDQPAAGKTGTAQDFGDAWFVGYTPYLATAVWMGNPDARVPMRNVGNRGTVTGGSFPAQIWNAFNADYHFQLDRQDFVDPDGTRSGRRIFEPGRDLDAESPCGAYNAEVDDDGDGRTDRCLNYEGIATIVPDPVKGCPGLLWGLDDNHDGIIDRCAHQDTIDALTATTTTAPPATTTTAPPAATTTAPPASTTTVPATTTTVPVATTTTLAVVGEEDPGGG